MLQNFLMRNKLVTVLLLFLLALLIRTYRLVDYPSGFTPDEAAQGYTAYSILTTGKDEWGVSFPLNPRSFGDFKAPVYTYLAIPSIAVFGLNEFAVRLPNALLGSLAVLVVYFMVKELCLLLKEEKGNLIALVSALFLTFNPWHLSLSRGAFEANLTTFFLPLGILLFMLGLRSSLFLVLSSLILGLNLFTYHSAKLVTPLIVVFLIFIFRRQLKFGKIIIPTVLFGSMFLIAFGSLFQGAGTRVADIGIFSGGWQSVAENRYLSVLLGLPDPLSRIFNNKIVFIVGQFINTYLSYLSPYFLFSQGAGEATYGMVPGRGLLYLVELPAIGIALYLLFKKKLTLLAFLLFWVLVGLIPASLSRGVGYHANRVAVIMPAINIISAYGFVCLFGILKAKLNKAFITIISIIFVFQVINFLQSYLFLAPTINSKKMFYGWREVSQLLRDIETKKVIISRTLSEPQAYLMFYEKMNPIMVQQQTKDWVDYIKSGTFVDQMGTYNLGRYTIKNLSFPEDKQSGVIMVGTELDFNGVNDGMVIKKVYYPGTDKLAFKVVKF